MTRFIKNAILIIVAIILVPLSVANRHPVTLALNPFDPQDPRLSITEIPLFWVIFASLGVGIVVGGIGAWVKQGKWRKEARVKRREASALNKEAGQLREIANKQSTATLPGLAAPTGKRPAA